MAAAVDEINLAALPPSLEGAKGHMRKVFHIIYSEFSKTVAADAEGNNALAEGNNNGTNNENAGRDNNNTYIIKAGVERICVFVMPDGRKLQFIVTPEQIHAYPDNEITITLSQSPDSLYLDSIEKSDVLRGVEATNYAYEIAAALGAKWLHVWDAAIIDCVPVDNDIHAYPLSFYRALTKAEAGPSWYGNVALKHGFTANTSLGEIYNYSAAIGRLRQIQLDELLAYYKSVKHFIETDQAVSYVYITTIHNDGSISGQRTPLEHEQRTTVIRQVNKIIDILSASESATLVDFLLVPASGCLDKGYILRGFPGAGNMDFEIPNILFDGDGEKLCEFPYLVDSLIVGKVSGHPIIKLFGGRKTRRGGRGLGKRRTRGFRKN
jgi:hypothetical protein